MCSAPRHEGPPHAGESLQRAALRVLCEPDMARKAELTARTAAMWRSGSLAAPRGPEPGWPAVPDRPARDDGKLQLVHPQRMRRLKAGGTLASRQAIVHALVHIEGWAVDLSWDIIARFGDASMPRGFNDDFVAVAEEECKHHLLLKARLEAMGSYYGALPAHDALWHSANATAHSLPARLAVEHCVHEARGLDVMPATVAKFRTNGDNETADLLEHIIYKEEITHCRAGVRWLTHLHSAARAAGRCADEAPAWAAGGCADEAPAWAAEARQHASVETWFHALVRTHFKGSLKPPFNVAARDEAGFTAAWYEPLAAEPRRRDTPASSQATPAAAAVGSAA
ncbi:hypothetical protein WJX81_001033 [Elliptochloris bilobata]|uniref:DUF455 family protein n=1 Tax=Elliptochloris bilobata TaxID=381761 RepID=A0AAW1SL32_9CHLO